MRFEIRIKDKTLIFDSGLRGLAVNGGQFIAGKDGKVIYDQTKGLKADTVELQMSVNTSTLIPALRILSIPYSPYFDKKDVVESQNNITFYWNRSKLAAFYNKFSTDELFYEDREPVIRKAVRFLVKKNRHLPLEDEFLSKVLEPGKLLGFYQGFPIFDGSTGFAKLQSRLGIHIGSENVMISTPLDKYEKDVYELAELISDKIEEKFSEKKNRVIFPKSRKLLELLDI